MVDPLITGGAAAGKAVVGKVLHEGEAETQALVEAGKSSHSMMLAGEIKAKRMAAQQALLLRIMKPLGIIIGAPGDYFKTDFAADLSAKTAHIPEDRLVDPPPYITVPVIQSLAYSVDEPYLKSMYLNLLASAVDGGAPVPHPSFVEVIRQISPAEAPILQAVLERRNLPIARVSYISPEDGSKMVIANHLLPPGIADEKSQPDLAIFVDNWSRLSLVSISYGEWFTAASLYDWMEASPLIDAIGQGSVIPVTESGNPFVLTPEKGTIEVTAFGREFLARAISGPSSPEMNGQQGE